MLVKKEENAGCPEVLRQGGGCLFCDLPFKNILSMTVIYLLGNNFVWQCLGLEFEGSPNLGKA